MNLVHEFTYRADLDANRLMVGPGPLGMPATSTVTYQGLLEMNQKVAAVGAGAVEFEVYRIT